jgi:rod shape-determining protein MreD
MTRIVLRLLNAPFLIFFVVVGIAIQSSLFNSWPLNYVQPDFVLLIVVWCALRRSFEEGGIITLIISNLSEIHSSSPQGMHFISNMAVFFLVRLSAKYLVISGLSTYVIVTIFSLVTWKLTGLLVLYLLGFSSTPLKHTITFILLGTAVEGLVAIWIYRWLEKFDWVTFKNARAEHASDEELQANSEGF